jgi:hypothetical protein
MSAALTRKAIKSVIASTLLSTLSTVFVLISEKRISIRTILSGYDLSMITICLTKIIEKLKAYGA